MKIKRASGSDQLLILKLADGVPERVEMRWSEY